MQLMQFTAWMLDFKNIARFGADDTLNRQPRNLWLVGSWLVLLRTASVQFI
jgi:hypothetical protein